MKIKNTVLIASVMSMFFALAGTAGTWDLTCSLQDDQSVLITNDSGRYLASYQSWNLSFYDAEGELMGKKLRYSFDEDLPEGQSTIFAVTVPAGSVSCEVGYKTIPSGP